MSEPVEKKTQVFEVRLKLGDRMALVIVQWDEVKPGVDDFALREKIALLVVEAHRDEIEPLREALRKYMTIRHDLDAWVESIGGRRLLEDFQAWRVARGL